MAAAFSSFVNDGTFTYSRAYTRVTDSAGNVIIDDEPRTIKAFSDNTAHVMTYMLERVVNSGTGTEAYLGTVPVAGKTGTSGDNQDRWFVGVTPYYSCAVWTGYDIPEHMYFSGNPAAYIFNRVMAPIHKGLEYRSFTYPLLEPDTKVFGNWAEEWAEAARQEREALQNQADNNNYYPVQDDYSQYYG
jgi:penicillin-binding protein 1A